MKRKRHTPEQVIRKLREAEVLQGQGQSPYAAHHGPYRVLAQPGSRFLHRRKCKQLICARNQAARVDLCHLSPRPPRSMAGGGGRESNPPDRDTRSHRF